METQFVIIEHYPDGGTWRHGFSSLREAQWAMQDLETAHPARKYVLCMHGEVVSGSSLDRAAGH